MNSIEGICAMVTDDAASLEQFPIIQKLEAPIDLSIVVPVYRGSGTIRELYTRLIQVIQTRGLSFEIVFVEDCGGDDSWNIIQALAGQDQRIRGLRLYRNYGQHNALLAGIQCARGELIATLDDDLQHPPEELPKLLDKLGNFFDVVYGSPQQEQHSALRNVASQITKLVLQRSMGVDAARHISAFRVFRTDLREAFTEFRSPTVNIDVLLTWATNRFAVVRVSHQPRQYGESGYDAVKLAVHAMNMMTGFTTLPLKLASGVGFIFTIFGVLIFAYVFFRYLYLGDPVPGFPFLASMIALFSGAQLLALGIIGEYLARMYQRSMEKPPYLVRTSTKKDN